jgi:hypothetical protein
MSRQQGSCHCGKVVFEYEHADALAVECNCSICRRKGAIWWAVKDEHFRILKGQDDLVLYEFGTRTAKHFFCRHCGVSTFSNPRLAPDRWAVNLRCVDDIDLHTLRITMFDGQNWEQSAEAFMRAKPPGGSQQAVAADRSKTGRS